MCLASTDLDELDAAAALLENRPAVHVRLAGTRYPLLRLDIHRLDGRRLSIRASRPFSVGTRLELFLEERGHFSALARGRVVDRWVAGLDTTLKGLTPGFEVELQAADEEVPAGDR